MNDSPNSAAAQPAADVSSPSQPATPAWHVATPQEVALRLETSADEGLAVAEAERRVAVHGRNELREQARRSAIRMFAGQFTDFMIVLLLAAAVISGFIGEVEDAAAIVAIVVLNAVIGFVQEYRAEKALRALKELAALQARVVRDGALSTIPAASLVPGDVVLLEAGSVVPADLRITAAAQLRVEEAALTGESNPVEKQVTAPAEADVALGDRVNMAYSGTTVTYGRGRGLVVATGMATELGKIATLLATTEEVRTPLQRRLARFCRQLSVIAIGICVLVFVLGVLRGESIVLMFLTAVSLAVAAVPEALPAVITIGLALGAQRMVRKNALIRRLSAVETLGSVTYICSDKTGTLTQNRMRADAFFVACAPARTLDPGMLAREPWSSFVTALAVSNDAGVDAAGEAIGDPTEVALYLAARDAGYRKADLEARVPRVAEFPFDSERKCMTTLHAVEPGGTVVAFTKGAPERVLERCTSTLTTDGHGPIDSAVLLAHAERMANDGLRVLAIARRDFAKLPDQLAPAPVERDLSFVGFVGLIDPPRPEAESAVACCRQAGVTAVMITGDHPLTAGAIATRLGIVEAGEARHVTGRELSRMSDEELAARVSELRVYARVDPEQKIRIVRALQARGEFVAMTGDGVNDAPALKRADIGVAMGKAGTDVAREASAMVLLDDNFASIVAAIGEGRRIYENLRKFIRFVLAGNTGEILTLLFAPLLGLPIPLLPIQILWVNLLTDGLPGLALAVEPEEKGLMQRPPRPPGESLFAGGLAYEILWVGTLIGALSIFTQWWAISHGSESWQTMVFTVLTFAQLFQVMAIRSERESLFTVGIASNRPLLAAVLLGAVLQLAVIYVPALNALLKTQPLTLAELGFCVMLPASVFVAIEIEKWLARRGVLQRGYVPPRELGEPAGKSSV
jgi:Ca2+-transporting ATPase